MRKEDANKTRKSGNGQVLVKRAAFRGKTIDQLTLYVKSLTSFINSRGPVEPF